MTTKPDCDVCRGACCEELIVTAQSEAEISFYAARGETAGPRSNLTMNGVTFSVSQDFAVTARCKELTGPGRCGIHETKPAICADFEPGNPDCLAAIRRPSNARRRRSV